jgi:hypothetical protein
MDNNGAANASYAVSGFTVYADTSWVTTFPSANDDAIQAAAVTGQILNQQQWTTGGLGLLPESYFIHTNESCFFPDEGTCYDNQDPPYNKVQIGPAAVGGGATQAYWKHIVAHEIGHYVQDRAMGEHEFDYALNASTESCKCDHYDTSWGNNIHCMQSRESVGGAQLEGFAHAFASRVFNQTTSADGTFVYYKPFLDDSNNVNFPPVAFDAFNPNLWMEDHCLASDQGVEMDWLNFYYRVAAESESNPVGFSDIFSIYELACTGSAGTKCNRQVVSWSALDSAASSHFGASNAQFIAFDTMGTTTGVAH